jgi:hypothetical protein
MKQHRYRITVEHLADKDGQPPQTPEQVQFETGNHDEVLGLIARARAHGEFDPDTNAAFLLGLKLFGEVMLMNRTHPLFVELVPHFGTFMKHFKARMQANAAEGAATPSA